MTGDYRIILPLMLATVMSTLVSRMISRESIYTLKLSRRGVHLQEGQDIDVMQNVTVAEAMTTEVDIVPMNMSLDELALEFERTHHHGFPVVNEDGSLAGVVSLQDYEQALETGSIEEKTVADIATTKSLILTYEDEPMWSALRKLALRDLSRLPVVKRDNEQQIIGVIRRRDIVKAYNVAIAKRSRQEHHTNVERLGKLVSSDFIHIQIQPGTEVAGKHISEIELPKECLIVSVQRGRKLYAAHGQTTLKAGDHLTIFVKDQFIPDVRDIMTRIPEIEDEATE